MPVAGAQRGRTVAGLVAAGLAAAVAAGAGPAARVSPTKAAAALVASLRAESTRAHVETFAASKVVSRNGRLWLAVGTTSSRDQTRVRSYRWSGSAWKLDGTVTGNLGPSRWISAVSLTGSRDPDFAVEGCGAGDNNCLSVVSDVGGRWHAVPFEYGYGETKEVNGVPAGRLVETEVDACGCAGGPSTWAFERYRDGVFRPADPPGRSAGCSASALATVAYTWEIQVLHFDRIACADGWALAVGTGTGFTGRVVGLFDRAMHPRRWAVLTLDNGMALPAAPATYDLPLPLLVRLAAGIGPAVAPQIAAARLVARLQWDDHFAWPLQNGMVGTGGADWLIAVVPAGRAPNTSTPAPVAAVVYRWNGSSWAVQGRVPRLPGAMNLEWSGGWFVAVPAVASSVAFAVAGSDSPGKGVLTNAGGTWHVVHP